MMSVQIRWQQQQTKAGLRAHCPSRLMKGYVTCSYFVKMPSSTLRHLLSVVWSSLLILLPQRLLELWVSLRHTGDTSNPQRGSNARPFPLHHQQSPSLTHCCNGNPSGFREG